MTTAAFQKLVAAFARDPHVEAPTSSRRAFGSNALKVDGRIFAMLVHGALVLKLPRPRVEALLAAKRGEPFATGRGRVMKEWIVLRGGSWSQLAREARQFVAGNPAPPSKRR